MTSPHDPMSPASEPKSARWSPGRVLIVAALVALAPVLVRDYRPFTFLFEDGTFYANVNRSLAEQGTFRQDAYTARSWYFDDLGWNRDLGQEWSNVALGADETTLYPKHAVLMPLVAQPFYLALGLDGLMVFNLLALVACAALLAWLVDPERRRPWAAAAVLATFAAPVVLRWAMAYSNDVFAGALVAGTVVAARTGRAGLAGVLAAGALWTRPLHVLALGAACGLDVLRWMRVDRRRLVRCVVGGTGLLAVWAGLNWSWFGSPFVTGYDRIVVRHGGVMMLESARAAFDVPLGRGVAQALFTSPVNFVDGFPMLAVVPLGWLALARRRAFATLASSVVALGGAVLVYAHYRWPSARFLFPFLLFIIEPLAALLEDVAAAADRCAAWVGRVAPTGWRRVAAFTVLGLVAVLAVRGVLALVRHPDASALAGVRVTANQGARPCDFFNLKWQRWECSHLDRDERDMVGAPSGRDCPADGGGWVRIPAVGPWRDKAVEVDRPDRARAVRWWVQSARGGAVRSDARVVVDGVATEADPPSAEDASGARTSLVAPSSVAVTFRVETDGRTGPAGAALCLRWVWLAELDGATDAGATR